MRRRLLIIGVALSVAAGGLSACGKHAASGAGSSAVVKAGAATTVSAAGMSVTLPAGSAQAGSKLQLSAVAVPSIGLPAEIHAYGQEEDVSLLAGLTSPATVSFPSPPGLSTSDLLPVVIWQDGTGGWRILPTIWAPGDANVTAQTDHFSRGFLGAIDVKAWASRAKSEVTDYITGRMGVAQPTCGDEAAVRTNGVKVTSDGGDTVKWCFGLDDGKRLLKVTNNRRTFTDVTFPSSWTVVTGSTVSFSTDTIARAFGTSAAKTPDRNARVLSGGTTLTLQVPAGGTGDVQAQMSIAAWAITGVFFGLDVYGEVDKVADSKLGSSTRGAPQKFLNALTGTGDAEITSALRTCSTSIGSLSDTPVSENAFVSTLKFAWSCAPAVMKAELEADTTGFARAAVVATITTAVSLVLTAANLLISGGRELYDSFASFAGHSDSIYDILIVTPAAVSSSPPCTAAEFGTLLGVSEVYGYKCVGEVAAAVGGTPIAGIGAAASGYSKIFVARGSTWAVAGDSGGGAYIISSSLVGVTLQQAAAVGATGDGTGLIHVVPDACGSHPAALVCSQ